MERRCLLVSCGSAVGGNNILVAPVAEVEVVVAEAECIRTTTPTTITMVCRRERRCLVTHRTILRTTDHRTRTRTMDPGHTILMVHRTTGRTEPDLTIHTTDLTTDLTMDLTMDRTTDQGTIMDRTTMDQGTTMPTTMPTATLKLLVAMSPMACGAATATRRAL